MSISSSEISSDERWRSSIRGPRSGERPVAREPPKPPPPRGRSKPVAITVTRISSPSSSSMTAPKMMLEFASAAEWISSAASLTSNSPRSLPPVMLSRMPVAPSTDSSSSGEEIAALAASDGAALAGARPDAHQRGAGVGHDRADVGEVEVDEARDRDQVGDALDALAQHVVGLAERVEDARAALDDREQLLVRDHDQRVDHLAQAVDALLRLARALRALELERARDDADRERADLVLGDLGDHGRGARAGAAALARGDEDHVGALQRLLDVVARLGRGALPDLRVGAGAEALGEARADVQLDVGVRHLERLGVGVARDELHAGEPGIDHPVHGIGSTAADSDDLYDCEIAASFHGFVSGPLVGVERSPSSTAVRIFARYGHFGVSVNARVGRQDVLQAA